MHSGTYASSGSTRFSTQHVSVGRARARLWTSPAVPGELVLRHHRIPAIHMLGRYSFPTNDDWITRILQRQIDLLREGGRHLEADHLCEAAGIQLRYNHDLMDRILP